MSPHVEVVFNRNKLYAEVWLEPVRTVAKRYEVSDVALAKTCRKLNVPLPPRGYWARSPARREAGRRALPKLKPGEPEEIKRGYWRYPKQDGPEPQRPASPPLEVEADVGPPICVPETLPDEPHRLEARQASTETASLWWKRAPRPPRAFAGYTRIAGVSRPGSSSDGGLTRSLRSPWLAAGPH